jgi:1-phosphofructokinase
MKDKVITITLNPSIDKTITVEKLTPYGLNRAISTRMDPGGKGINVARVLKNFGVDVMVSGLIAGDQGKLLKNYLKKSEIYTDFMETSGETRTNLKIIDESVNKTTEINESGFYVSHDDLMTFKRKFQSLLKDASIVVISGSVPPGVPSDFYAECISIAKTEGVKTLLDADGDTLTEGLKAVPYAIKPNIHELELLGGCTFSNIKDIVNAVQKLIEEGIEIAIVSMGPDGAIVANQHDVYKVDSWDVKVKSAVGAGDSMVGALAYSIVRNDSLFDIAKITTAAGTITATKAGTEICTLNEVLSSIKNVVVTKI